MGRALLAFAALSTALAALPLHAKDALPLPAEVASRADVALLKPTGSWVVDFAGDNCRLQRDFELNGERHVVELKQQGPEDSFQMVAAGPALAKLGNRPDLAWGLRSDLPLTADPREAITNAPDLGPAVFVRWATLGEVRILMTRDGIALQDRENTPNAEGVYLNHGQINPAAAAKVERIVFANMKDGAAVSFETGNMMDAFAALNACTGDLLTSWGLDPARHRTYKSAYVLNFAEAFALITRNIPRGVNIGQSLPYRLIVEADGKISDCHAGAEAKVAGAEKFCQTLMRKLKMAPARDAEGNPMRSFYTSAVSRAGA
ncbi:hypothetical protein [Erythrobacter oryzae]|uniref:hypothetical protein n=1 Tax=Erythrobacter oryzae TaxID=3019556 RepID=UPI0025527DAB|nr:hypothetical protein [Erythrobacter sp. COR-2]